MHIFRRFRGCVAIGVVLALFVGHFALADTFENNLGINGSTTINSGGSTTITYDLRQMNNSPTGDPNGCDVDGTHPASVTISLPIGNKVSADRTTFTFTGCQANDAQQVVFSSSHPGDYSITASISGGKTGSLYTNNAAFTLHVNNADTTAPVLTLPSNMTLEATSASGAVATYTASAIDNVDGSVPVTCGPASGSTFPIAVTTVNCSAHDAAGNVANGSFTVTVRDTTAPSISGTPSTITVEAQGTSGATVTYTKPTATDAVDGTDAVICAPASGSTFAIGTTTVTCSATDARSNTSTSTFSVVVRDTTAPVIAVGNVTAEASGPSGAAVTYTASASDLVDGAIAPVCAPVSGSTFAIGTTTVNCSATDAHGNKATASFTVTVRDTTAPHLTLPSDIVKEATGAAGAPATYSAAATDAVDGTVTVSCSNASGSTFPIAVTVVTCTATDAHGNSATGTFNVTVQDTSAPSLALPSNMTAEATSASGAVVTYAASATDVVDGPVAIACSPASGSTFQLGITTVVQCSAHDSHLNAASGSFSIKVQDTTAPALTLPNDTTTEATSAAGAHVPYVTSASDVVDGTDTVSCTPSGSDFAIGDTTVSCSATDAAGNTANGSFKISVVDTTAPAIAGTPSDVTAEATSSSGAVVTFTDPTATDVVDGPVTVGCTPASGSTFALDHTTSVTCAATDAHHNTSHSSFAVTVSDTQAPVVVVPSDITAEATSADGAKVTFAASASDAVDGDLATSCTPSSGSTFVLGDSTVHCSATDAHGHTATSSFGVNVADTTAPDVTVPDDVTTEATASSGAVVEYATSASDLVDGALATSCTPDSGSTFGLGATTVNCSATDAHGNTGHNSFSVTVQDTTAPALHLPHDITMEATGPSGAPVTYPATAADIVDGAVDVTCSTASGDVFGLGLTEVDCSATDAHGNTSNGAFNVTIRDTTAPSLSVPADMTPEATGPTGAVVTYETSASDVVDGIVGVTCTPPSGSGFALDEETTVSCSTTDSHGNTATGSFTVKVVDTTAPEISSTPTDVTAEAESSSGARVTFTNPTAKDVVDGDLAVDCQPPSGSIFALDKTSTVTCSVSDAHGNRAASDFHVFVRDTTAPVLVVPADITAEATGPAGADVTYAPTADDLVDGSVPVSCDVASGSTFAIGSATVTCSATDAHSNGTSAAFHVTVRDTTPPALSLPADITTEATGSHGAIVTYDASASDIVDGPVALTCSSASGATYALGVTTVHCSSTDAHHNTARGSFDITVQDTTAPSLHLPADMTKEATGPEGAAATYDASATDAVDGTDAVTCAPPSRSTFAIGATSVECSSTDAAGNTAYGSFGVSVQDTTAPVLSLPDDITAEATGPDGAPVSYAASAVDLVDGGVTPTCAPASGSTFALDVATEVDCSATDAHGNASAGSFHVKVVDTTGPAISGTPSDVTVEAQSSSGSVVTFDAPTAHDDVDGPRSVLCTPASGSTFPLDATTTVDCVSTDHHHNATHSHFGVSIHDTSGPVLTLPTDMTAEATGPDGAAVTFSPSASDAVDGAVAPSCAPASGSTFPIATTAVQCSATDAHHNGSSGSFNVSVHDTTAPVLSLPGDVTAEAGGPSGAAVTYGATAHDIVDGNVGVSCSPLSGSTFALGTTTVNCSTHDAHGNASGGSFHVTVRDTTAPALHLPGNLTPEATGPSGATVTFSATATDVVDGTDPVSCTPASGSTFALDVLTTVNCTTSDAAHNPAGASFAVKVVDTTAPSVTPPANVTTGPTDAAGASVTYGSAKATDAVDVTDAVSCAPASGSHFNFGTTTVTCNATDTHANKGTATFTVTVGNFTFLGFFQPTDNMPTVNTVKNGSTVPVKWNLQGQGGVNIMSTAAVSQVIANQVSCAALTGDVLDAIEATVTGSTTLRYDTTALQFIYNWQTPPKASTCWRVDVVLTDKTTKSAFFKLK